MNKKIAIMISASIVVLALAAGCTPKDQGGSIVGAEKGKPVPPPLGRFKESTPNDAVIRLWLTADGTMIRAEGKKGGNWEKQAVLNGTPASLGKPLADIRMWEHDGTETDVKIEDGTKHGKTAHPHSGLTNPPWGSHCHRWIRIDSQYVIVHC